MLFIHHDVVIRKELYSPRFVLLASVSGFAPPKPLENHVTAIPKVSQVEIRVGKLSPAIQLTRCEKVRISQHQTCTLHTLARCAMAQCANLPGSNRQKPAALSVNLAEISGYISVTGTRKLRAVNRLNTLTG